MLKCKRCGDKITLSRKLFKYGNCQLCEEAIIKIYLEEQKEETKKRDQDILKRMELIKEKRMKDVCSG